MAKSIEQSKNTKRLERVAQFRAEQPEQDLSLDKIVEMANRDIDEASSRVLALADRAVEPPTSSEAKTSQSIFEGGGFSAEMGNIKDEIIDLARSAKDKIARIISRQREIISGEFDPEVELREIKSAPKEERGRLLKEFKDKLRQQRAGLARVQEQVIAAIRKNPDAPREEIYRTAAEFASKYGINEKQLETIAGILWQYEKKHEKVREIRKQYTDDKKLYAVVFGRLPKGKIKVVEGPMTLYFRCYDIDDYAFIRSLAFLYSRNVDRESIEEAKTTGGVSMANSLVPGLEGTIIAENASIPQRSDVILKHEEQHAIKMLFGDKFVLRNTLADFEIAETDKEREAIIKLYIRHDRELCAEEGARDEILAFFKGGANSPAEILEILTKPKEKGGLYDYLAGETPSFKKWYVDNLGKKFRPLVDKAMDEVFGEEYKRLLAGGIAAFVKLKKSGYSTDRTIAVLIHEPLRNWRKVVNRLIEKK